MKPSRPKPSSETQQLGLALDSVKLGAAVAIVLAAIVGFYYFEGQVHPVVRVLGILAAAGVAVFVALQTQVGRNAAGFLGETRTEVRKVVWPTHQETLQTSLMVIVVTIIISLFLAAVDWAIGALVRSLLSGGV